MKDSTSLWWMCSIFVALSAAFFTFPQPALDWEHILPSAEQYMKELGVTTSSTTSTSPPPPLEGLVVAVTGSTSGIGLALTRMLSSMGAKVLAIGRSPSKLQRLFGDETSIDTIVANANDLASIANASHYILEHYDRLDVLVNNAGIHSGALGNFEAATTKQGYDLVFGVNYLSHFLLTEKLLPLMEKSSKKPKIVQISSSFHWGVDGTDLGTRDGQPVASLPGGSHGFVLYRSQRQYANSKLAQILHARALQKRHESVTTVSVCPAWVGTQIAAGEGTLVHSLFTRVAFPANEYGLSSVMHAMFDDKNTNDFYINVDSAATRVIDAMHPWMYSLLPIRDVICSMFAGWLLFSQRFGPVRKSRESSRASYNQTIQEELYSWSKQAVMEWL